MVGYVLRRMLLGAAVVLLTGVIAVVGWRALRPDQFPGESLIGGSWHQLTRAFLIGVQTHAMAAASGNT